MNDPMARRIHATVAGLCAGDAMSWPAWWHRLDQLPPRRAVRLQQAHAHARMGVTSSVPTPYLHATAPSTIDPGGPTDDAEWFVVAVRHHLGQRLDGGPVLEGGGVWIELAKLRASDPEAVRGRIGVVLSLANLTAGLEPPASGNDNAHWFDDLACVRAVAAGLLRPGQPEDAADLAESDAIVTNSHDGVWGARATAALIASLVVGEQPDKACRLARMQLPDSSWIAAVVDQCLAMTDRSATPLGMAARLEREVVDHVYAYANQAPETMGLLLAHLLVARDGNELLLGALAHPRHADSLVALAGAVAGAGFGDPIGEPGAKLTGTSIRQLAGVDMGEVADLLVARASGLYVADRQPVAGLS